jgi:hypothetical protein
VALGIAWIPLMKLISAQIYQYLPSEEHLRGLTFGARRAAPLEPRSPHFAFADTPRLVVNAGCAIPATTPPENLRAMIRAARA